MTTATEISKAHIAALESMTPDQLLAVARELFANQIRMMAAKNYQMVTREESLDGIFEAEANARASGAAVPKVDFFLPITTEIPFEVEMRK